MKYISRFMYLALLVVLAQLMFSGLAATTENKAVVNEDSPNRQAVNGANRQLSQLIQQAKQSKSSDPQRNQQVEPQSLSLPPQQVHELYRIKILRDVQNELTKWAKQRFWFIAIIVVIVGFFGLRSFVRDLISKQLQDALKSAAKAEAAAEHAKESTASAVAKLGGFDETMSGFERRSEQLSEGLSDLRKTLEAEQKRIEANTTHEVASADLEIKALKQELSKVSQLVEQLMKESEENKEVLERFEDDMATLEEMRSKNRKEFEENSAYSVEIVDYGERHRIPAAEKLFEILRSKGFKVSSGIWSKDSPINEEISVEYAPSAVPKLNEVRDLLESVFHELGHPTPRIEQKEGMLGGVEGEIKKKIWIFF